MNHSKSIDFLIVSFKRLEYIKIAVQSIHKYVTCPYKITVIDNGDELKELSDLFKDDELVSVIEGPQKGVWKKQGDGSKNHSAALTLGMKNTDGDYICFFDYDSIFLNEWVDSILPLLDENFFVTNRFDRGIAREMFMIFKREEFEKHDLYPDATHVDSAGNITKYAMDNKLYFVVLENSAFTFNGGFVGDKSNHVLDLPHGEQVSISGVPFFYHYGRGATRGQDAYDKWVDKTKQYLEIE